MPRPTTALHPSLLELIGEVYGLLDLDEFRPGLLSALKRAVPVDWISLNDINSDPAATVVLIDPEFPPEAHQLYARYAHENPLLARYQDTLDGRPYRFSDVATAQALHATSLYQEFYAPIGLEHQIAFTLPHQPERVLALALSRKTHDFSDQECELLSTARPFLIQSYRNAGDYTRLRAELDERNQGLLLPLADPRLASVFAARGVTAREAEVLSWITTRRSDRAIAQQLGLSQRTVQKHLQRCYRKLSVNSRTEAIALAWSLTGKPASRPRRRTAV